MEKNNYNNGIPPNATGDFFLVTEYVSPLQQQLLHYKILLSNTSADAMSQAELNRDMQLLNTLEHLVEAEKQQQPHYAVSRLVSADAAIGSIFSLGGMTEVEDDEDEQPGKLAALSHRISQLFDLSTLFADLREERTSKAAELGQLAAKWWYAKQVLRTIPQLILRAGRNLTKSMNQNSPRSSSGSLVETTFINVLVTLLATLLAESFRRIIR